jgi:hypothetical protein
MPGAARSWFRRLAEVPGAEKATIHEDGTYDVNGTRCFRIDNVSYDPSAKKVAFSKVSLPENPYAGSKDRSKDLNQREELEILSPDQMHGHVAGEPDFLITYDRVKP